MTDAIQDAANLTARAIGELKASNKLLEAEAHDLRIYAETLLSEFNTTKSTCDRALAERDYYMRECARLGAKFTMFASMANDALREHSNAPFRPNGAPPKDEPATSDESTLAVAEALGVDDPIPEFLTKPLLIGQPLKVKLPSGWHKTSGDLKVIEGHAKRRKLP